jgi:pimeloyl-ACP methyl ester carboxylesterase
MNAAALRTEKLETRTADGVRLAVVRVTAQDPGLAGTRGAVLMVHGLGSNAAVYRVPSLSLADHLAAQGHDCFVAELRGAGGSERPAQRFGLGDYLTHDIPALLELARGASGRPRVSWLGHSMGGFLALMYGIDHADAPLERIVAVASSLDYRPGQSIYRSLRKLRPLAGALPVLPFSLLATLTVPFAGWGPRFLPEGMNFHRANIEPSTTRYLLGNGFSAIQTALLDDLDTTFGEDGFTVEGRLPYLARAAELRVPTLLVGGSRDLQCTPEASALTFELLSSVRDKKLAMFGKPYGHAEDYGHFDLIVGKRAQSEVWPEISAFLAGHGS